MMRWTKAQGCEGPRGLHIIHKPQWGYRFCEKDGLQIKIIVHRMQCTLLLRKEMLNETKGLAHCPQ